jgi:hypothetical protein
MSKNIYRLYNRSKTYEVFLMNNKLTLCYKGKFKSQLDFDYTSYSLYLKEDKQG